MFELNKEDMSIYVTRGDVLYFDFYADDNGKNYKFKPGDVVRIAVAAKKNMSDVVLQKDFPVEDYTEKVRIYLTKHDTKIGNSISKPTDYWYEIVLNPFDEEQTIIGYDEEGPKLFRLFPEAEEINEPDPAPEEIPIVDQELDMTSQRPVANQAISRAYQELLAGYERTHAAVAKLHVTPEMFGAIGDGVADDTEAFQKCIDSGSDIIIPEGCYVVSDSLNINGCVRMQGRGEVVIDFNGDTLFNISSYYKMPFELRNVQIRSNGKKVIYASNGGWGAGVFWENVLITGADDSCIELGGAFNAVFKRVNVEGTSASTGTLVKLGVNPSSTAFSNLIYFESCIFSANRNANLIEVGNAMSVKAVNCTLTGFNCAVTGTMTLIGCWFEDGEQCVPSRYDGLLMSPHFANVTNIATMGNENYDLRPGVKKTSVALYNNIEQSLLKMMFDSPVDEIETLYAATNAGGVYSQEPIYKISTKMVLYNTPINKLWATSDTSRIGFALDVFSKQHVGVFEVKINYFRLVDGEIAQRCSWHGIIKDGVAIMLDTMDSLPNYPSSITYNSDNCYLSYGSANGGTSMGWLEFNRLSY